MTLGIAFYWDQTYSSLTNSLYCYRNTVTDMLDDKDSTGSDMLVPAVKAPRKNASENVVC